MQSICYSLGESGTNHVIPPQASLLATSASAGKVQSSNKTAYKTSNTCKRNHSIGNILDSNSSASHSVKCLCSQQPLTTTSTNRNLNSKTLASDLKRQSICTLDHPSSHAHPLAHIKPIDSKRLETNKYDVLSPKNGCKPIHVLRPAERVTIACGLLGSRSGSSMRPKSCHLPIGHVTLALADIEADNDRMVDKSNISAVKSPLLNVDDSLSTRSSTRSGQTSIFIDGVGINAPIATPTSPITISLSKSETNIFEGDDVGNKLAVYNVVSLNDLHETDSFLNPRQMNDLSKNQFLHNISEFELLDKQNSKSHTNRTAYSVSSSQETDINNTG